MIISFQHSMGGFPWPCSSTSLAQTVGPRDNNKPTLLWISAVHTSDFPFPCTTVFCVFVRVKSEKRLKISGLSAASYDDVIFHNHLQVRSPLMTLVLGQIRRSAILCIVFILFQAMEIVFVSFLSDVVDFPCIPFNLRTGWCLTRCKLLFWNTYLSLAV